jgi:hypothetical protein
MPSPSNPVQTVSAGTGPQQGGAGNASGALAAALLAHITDASGAHAASAISYAGDGTWADGTTNPASTVETQLDKIIGDLGSGDGAGKIRYDGGSAWLDGTTNPATTVGAQLDKILSDLIATAAPSGAAKIGAAQIVNQSITLPAGSIQSFLQAISLATGVQYEYNANWADTTAFPDNSVQAALDEIVGRLANTTAFDSGTRKIGCEQITNTSFTIPAQELVLTVRDISRAPNIQYNAGPAWLGGRTNPAATVQAQLNKIINDLGATSAGDDGAERIGAEAIGDLLGGSVRAQLNELDTGWGKLSRANTWTNAQNFMGVAGDTNPAILSDTLPTDRKLLWQMRNHTVFTDIFFRMYNDRGFGSFLLTTNAVWNGTAWQSDDTNEPSVMYRFNNLSMSIFDHGPTASTWGTSGWEIEGRYSSQAVFLGNTTLSGPASIACTFDAENGRLQFSNSADATGSDTNPPATQGHINVLKAKNIPKMWANIVTSSDTIQDGFNIASISSSGNTCVVNIQNDMVVDDFACVAMCMSDQQILVYSSARTTGSVTLKAWNANTGTQVALGTTPIVISVILFGKQDS